MQLRLVQALHVPPVFPDEEAMECIAINGCLQLTRRVLRHRCELGSHLINLQVHCPHLHGSVNGDPKVTEGTHLVIEAVPVVKPLVTTLSALCSTKSSNAEG